MKTVTKITEQKWIKSPATEAVMNALTADGAVARFVGGCVRNALLNLAVSDVDIATDSLPEETVKLLEKAGIRAVPTGIKHGTVTAVIGKKYFEITTLRSDIKTDGRHAEVAFSKSWTEDAKRRDLTINTFFADLDGTVYDPLDSFEDLKNGVIRFVGNPKKRLEEDILRLLRFFRFYAYYGRSMLDDEALEVCREKAFNLKKLSGERIRDELFKILKAPDPKAVLLLMQKNGILEHFLPEAINFDRLNQMVQLENTYFEADALRRLAAVFGSADIKETALRLKLSNKEKNRLIAIVTSDFYPETEKDMHRFIYYNSKELFIDLVLMNRTDDKWKDMLKKADAWQIPIFPISGKDAQAIGITKGIEIGKALKSLEKWWIENDFTADREQLLERLAEPA